MDRKTAGTALIIIGVLVWPVGLWVLPAFGIHPAPVPDLLVPHLCGVVPGVYLRGSKILKKLKPG
ncbi:MAG: hypothetical protein GXO65_04560 [Euryarchaeota archaeon]|nr:hypothetical protein [Euryarchaeota archaeon]